MALPPTRAVIIVSYNVIRVIFRKYGLYLCIGITILLFQGFSGYYLFKIESDDSLLVTKDLGGIKNPSQVGCFFVLLALLLFN